MRILNNTSMIDIFKDTRLPPRLYIADVELAFEYRPRKNSIKTEKNVIKLKRIPIVLEGTKFPTAKTKDRFMRRIFEKHGKGKFEESNIRVTKLENMAFSSNLAYEFNYNTH